MGINALKSRPAIFLDRDGTLIRQVELLTQISKIKLLPGVAKVVKTLNRLGFLAVVVTNQPVVARGLITPHGIDKIHAVLIERFGRRGAKIEAIYYCPHHPKADVKKYRLRCHCRKPASGMIIKAVKDLNINLKKSFMIGDAIIDIVTGKRAGLKTILVKTGPGHTRLDKKYKVKSDFTARNLNEAVKIIKKYAG